MLCENEHPSVLNLILNVLILVIVEYALWGEDFITVKENGAGLNPCYSGICSVSISGVALTVFGTRCLNPCYSGICSVRQPWWPRCPGDAVLILVIVEYALWERPQLVKVKHLRVLILVIVEYALWEDGTGVTKEDQPSVLILVIVEYALWVGLEAQENIIRYVLILVRVEYALWGCFVYVVEI